MPRGLSAPPLVAIDVINQPFGDDSMTRQSAAALYQADSIPPYEPPVSAPVSRPQVYAQEAPETSPKTTSRRRHRPRRHSYVRHESAPTPAAPPAARPNVVVKVFTWWNHLMRGHTWAQVPWAPKFPNASSGQAG